METVIVYFGCWGDAGHFLWGPNKQRFSQAEVYRMDIPKAGDLDGSRLFLPRPERVGHGCLTYLPAPNRTILAWWGNNPWDKRGAVNQAVITNGDIGEPAMWRLFTRYFASLAPQLKQPVLMPTDQN